MSGHGLADGASELMRNTTRTTEARGRIREEKELLSPRLRLIHVLILLSSSVSLFVTHHVAPRDVSMFAELPDRSECVLHSKLIHSSVWDLS